MVKIGAVGIDVSHPLAFSKIFETGTRARYTAVYNDGFRTDEEVSAFMALCGGAKRYDSIREMADHVDIGFIHSCNWEKHIGQAMPFIEAGKPVFIDKPIVGSVAHCRKIEDLVARGAVVLGSSSARYSPAIEEFLSTPESERGRLVNVFGTSGVDEFNYGVHIVEAIGALLGTGARSTRYAGAGTVDGKLCESFCVTFDGGASALYNVFSGVFHPFQMVVMTTTNTYQFALSSTTANYQALLDRLCAYIETGGNALAPISEITESVKIMIAGKVSKEHDGQPIDLCDLPDDAGYDGNAFEAEYARNAKNIYLA